MILGLLLCKQMHVAWRPSQIFDESTHIFWMLREGFCIGEYVCIYVMKILIEYTTILCYIQQDINQNQYKWMS